jgi:hypothetical protein
MLDAESVAQRAASALGLDPEATDLLSGEGISAALRRAASFLCPASRRQIVDAVLDALRPLSEAPEPGRDDLNSLLELVVASGDLLEVRDASQSRNVYLGPPSYIARSVGKYLLLGVRPYGAPLLEGSLADSIAYEGVTRTTSLDPAAGTAQLKAAGLQEIKREDWLRSPRSESWGDLLSGYRIRLDVAIPAGQVPGLTVLDPASPVRYYVGRRRDPKATDNGDFVGRRPQAYGNDMWCFVRLASGQPTTLLDLPISDVTEPGRYEAWRLQAALDAERGRPQQVRVRPAVAVADQSVLDLFGPVPGWAQRALELVGLPIERTSGALQSYRLPNDVVPEAISFLRSMLWLEVVNEEGR